MTQEFMLSCLYTEEFQYLYDNIYDYDTNSSFEDAYKNWYNRMYSKGSFTLADRNMFEHNCKRVRVSLQEKIKNIFRYPDKDHHHEMIYLIMNHVGQEDNHYSVNTESHPRKNSILALGDQSFQVTFLPSYEINREQPFFYISNYSNIGQHHHGKILLAEEKKVKGLATAIEAVNNKSITAVLREGIPEVDRMFRLLEWVCTVIEKKNEIEKNLKEESQYNWLHKYLTNNPLLEVGDKNLYHNNKVHWCHMSNYNTKTGKLKVEYQRSKRDWSPIITNRSIKAGKLESLYSQIKHLL